MSNIDSTLNERGSRYGNFEGHARITQTLKGAMRVMPKWALLKDDQKEALEMTAHKIGRILNGDPNYIDSWHDIIGYIRLVEQRLEREQAPKANSTNAPDKAFTTTAADIKPEHKSDAQLECGCPACELRRKMESALGTNIEVIILTEESGDTD